MSKNKLVIFTIVAAMVALALTACSAPEQEKAKAAFVGEWKLHGMVEKGKELSPNDISLMESMNMTVDLSLSEDGAAVFNMFGSQMKGTWKASSPQSGTITFEGETIDMTISDEILTFTQGSTDTKLSFSKGEVKEPASGNTASNSSASESSSANASEETSKSSSANE